MKMTTASLSSNNKTAGNKLPPQHTWLTIFIPALFYYIFLSSNNKSNLSSSSSSNHGILSQLGLLPTHLTTVSTQLTRTTSTSRGCDGGSTGGNSAIGIVLDSIFHKNSNFEYVIQNNNDNNISSSKSKSKFMDTTWVEDVELGRGYLLISDIQTHGVIWRYEIGGGPIPIGKSLFMNYSGCRSNFWNTCFLPNTCSHEDSDYYYGSHGMTIQITKDSESFFHGQLIIVEKGEQRIIRLEKDGTRTPLVLNVTASLCTNNDLSSSSSSRIENPSLVVYTPFGDLLFTDWKYSNACNDQENARNHQIAGLYRLKEVVNIPSLHSFQQSKDAHKWTESDLQTFWMEHNGHSPTTAIATMELLLSNNFEYISGVVIGKDLTSLYVAGKINDDVVVSDGDRNGDNDQSSGKVRFVIMKVTLDDDDDDEEDDVVDISMDDDDDDEENDDVNNYNEKNDNMEDTKDNEKIKTNKGTGNRTKGLLDDKATIFYDMTTFFQQSSSNIPYQPKLQNDNIGISLAIDEHGLIYATFPNGIAIINEVDGTLLAILELQEFLASHNHSHMEEDKICGNGFDDSIIIPTSINIGKDQYIYITTEKGLIRMKTKTKPLEYPTNLIVPSRKKK